MQLTSRQKWMLAGVIGMGLVLIFGFIAVMGTIAYRFSTLESRPEGIVSISIGEDAAVEGVDLNDEYLAVTVLQGGERSVLLIDPDTGKIARELRFVPDAGVEPPIAE